MAARSILALASAAAVAQAIQITAPSNSSGWNTHGSQLIQWTVSPLSNQLSPLWLSCFVARIPFITPVLIISYSLSSPMPKILLLPSLSLIRLHAQILSPPSSTLLMTLTSTCPPATLRLVTVIGSVSLLLTVVYWLRAMNLASPTVLRKFLF